MRTIGMPRAALDMMCERALSRQTAGSRLADKQYVQGQLIDDCGLPLHLRNFIHEGQ